MAIMATALTLASCAVIPAGAPGPRVDAPNLHVGDRWVYHGTDGYRLPVVWDETHEVTAIEAKGITVHVTLIGPSVDIQRTETWSAPGIVRSGAVYEAETDDFDPPLVRYKFPLIQGESWDQTIRDVDKPPNPYGPIHRYALVGGFESVTTPAGTFNAIRIRVIMQLDDETFWRYPTECEYLVWYAPAVSAMVKEEKRASYRNKGGLDAGGNPFAQNATLVLTSFTYGR
ncbi:MAG TPA: hypothetical protein VGJ08_16225 [Rhizomicrobium sp.]|jgi:hypothetical protein